MLADRLRSCLQESDELPKDFTTLFSNNLFKFDTDLIPEAIDLFRQLNVKHEPLTLIPPQFETPMPEL
jgi:intraflagellar transport protein 52